MARVNFKDYELGKQNEIQVLRGVSILGVLLFHISGTYFPNGYLGVDVFFLISGFLVTPLILKAAKSEEITGRSRYFEFFLRRIYRLIPALGFLVMINTLLMLLLANTNQHLNYAKQSILSLFALGNVGAYLYSGDYFNPAPNPLIHSWSLGTEEQIYIFLTILFTFLFRKKVNFKNTNGVHLILICSSLLLYLMTSIRDFDLELFGIANKDEFFFYFSPARIWEFCVGGLISLNKNSLLKRLTFLRKAQPGTAIAILLILFYPTYLVKEIATLASILIGSIFLLTNGLGKFHTFPHKFLVWVGLRSYSIYLWHMPMIYFARYSPLINSSKFSLSIAMILTVIFANYSYKQIEVPWILNQRKSKYEVKKLLVNFLTLPLIFSLAIIFGVNNSFWGLDKNIDPQPYAGTSDPACLRDSEDGPACYYSTNGASRNVLLIGDSHAAHLSQALINAGRHRGWNVIVWTSSGCRFQLENSIQWNISSKCLKRNNEILRFVRKNPVDLIVVSEYIHKDSPLRILEKGLIALKSENVRVSLIENTPVFPQDSDSLVGRPLIISGNAPKSVIRNRMADFEASPILDFYSLVRRQGIGTLNVNDIYCDMRICHRFKSGVGWLYSDNDHLSIAGASLLEQKLQLLLR